MSNYGFYHFVSRFLLYEGRSAPISHTRNIILSLPAALFLLLHEDIAIILLQVRYIRNYSLITLFYFGS